jgi:hypothetical protein
MPAQFSRHGIRWTKQADRQFDPPKGLRLASRANPTRVTGCLATIAEETDKWGEVVRTVQYQAGVSRHRGMTA